MAITRFRGEFFALSNMYPLKVHLPTIDGYEVPTSEHYYMVHRLHNRQARILVALARAVPGDRRPYADGLAAKEAAYKLMERGVSNARTAEERINIMRQGVGLKVFYNPDVAQVLDATGDEVICEGNDWGDRFWGVDPPASDNGENHLGHILMEHRDVLRRTRGISIDI